MGWDRSTFPDADDPRDVGWLISYWRIVPYKTGGKTDYRLESRMFEHLVKAATRKEALKEFQMYVDQKRLSGKMPSVKGLALFLAKVDTMVIISDNTGEMVND